LAIKNFSAGKGAKRVPFFCDAIIGWRVTGYPEDIVLVPLSELWDLSHTYGGKMIIDRCLKRA
jgi:hypothetical protein